jgi:hypothetical protein
MAKARKPASHWVDQTTLSSSMQQLLASLRLEGIELSPESMKDVELFDAGKITKAEFLKRAIGRAQAKPS